MTTYRDQAAQLIEEMSQREIRQLAEYCVDHINDINQCKELADYLRVHVAMNSKRLKK